MDAHWLDALALPILGRGLLILWEGHVFKRAFERFAATRAVKKPTVGRVSVFAPCKGDEEGLRASLNILGELDYPDYEIVFIVEDERDGAFPLLKEFQRRHPDRARIVTAGKADESGQKVHNLLAGVKNADPASEIFVFLDSDVALHRDWLSELVAPLADASVGATTGMRWYSLADADFPTVFRSCWNGVIVGTLKPSASSFVWGGSMALRRRDFEDLNVAERWRGTLSDDYVLSETLREAKRRMVLVPTCMVVSPDPIGFRDLIEFTNRQIVITKVYHRTMWAVACAWYAFYFLVFLVLASRSISEAAAGRLSTAHLALAGIVTLGFLKEKLLLDAIKVVLGDGPVGGFAQRTLFGLLHAPTAMLYGFNTLVSLFKNRITWRGITYVLDSKRATRIIRADG